MNYLFFYYGEIPKYVGLALNNILNVDKDADIYFATDQKIENLANKKINIQVISTSEIKISVLVNKNDAKKALAVLHKEFKLEK